MHRPNPGGLLAEALLLPRVVAHNLLAAKPYGVEFFDYLVGTAHRFWRVQVKSSTCLRTNNMYQVGVHHVSRRGASHNVRPYAHEDVDFIAIYIVPEDTWYIVPVEIVDQRLTLVIHAHDHPKRGPWLPYREAWHLLRHTGERPILPDPEPNAPTPRRRRAGNKNADLSFRKASSPEESVLPSR